MNFRQIEQAFQQQLKEAGLPEQQVLDLTHRLVQVVHTQLDPGSSATTSLLPTPTGAYQVSAPPLAQHPIFLSLIVPTYNERQNVASLVDQLSTLLDATLRDRYELIIVDDDSPDQTWEVAQSLLPQYPQLRVIRRQTERGLSTAVLRGWQASQGEVLGVIDGDLQHPPDVLLKLINAVEQGADLALASRHADGGGVSDWQFIRRLLSRGAQLLGLMILPGVVGRVSDPMSGYFLVRREAILARSLNPLGYKILIEVLARGAVYRIREVGYVFRERQEGESKVTWRQYVDYLRHLVQLRFSLGATGRFLRFALVGFSGVFVDMVIFYLLSDPSTLHWGLTRSKVIAAEIAIINNFLWNDAWTFGDVARQQGALKQRFKRLVKFNLVCLAGLALNVVILNLLFNTLHLDRYVANLLAIAIVTLWNFWINLKLSWRVTDVK
jgi:dolichol-phosphate mannosyltransferase